MPPASAPALDGRKNKTETSLAVAILEEAFARYRAPPPERHEAPWREPAAPCEADARPAGMGRDDGGPFATCQFIAGDPRRGAEPCGRPSRAGSSYCAAHHALCHLPPEEAEDPLLELPEELR
ncbi:MAG: hypothetical protein KIT20_06750 [Alphaproteobacteria bacterium]|nr:hypothetical protein [Alphaproteobacteria bacterium]